MNGGVLVYQKVVRERPISVNGAVVPLHMERLLLYGLQSGLIMLDDYFVVRNSLYALFGVKAPTSERVDRRVHRMKLPTVLKDIIDCGVALGICGDSAFERQEFGSKVMGILTPRGSEVSRRFWENYKISPENATNYFYTFARSTAYIKPDDSIRWRTRTTFGSLDITINLVKPEKDPREIAEARKEGASTRGVYPKCIICPQNAGYHGGRGLPNRENHRVIKLTNLGGVSRHWFLQYSPYQYYKEHCVIVYENHVPMKIDRRTFDTLFDFVDRFPHYFIGSNADLPIVGGSILSHEHYQAGRYVFPIEDAETVCGVSCDNFPDIRAYVLKWPLSTIKLCGADRESLSAAAVRILDVWREYSDERAGILAYTSEEYEVKVGHGSGRGSHFETRTRPVPHNSITPILRKSNGAYELYIILRNNRTSEQRPLGVFHPNSDVWHIKKENIGLIEAMGLAILPPRLDRETAKIANILCGRLDPSENGFYDQHPELLQHKPWIERVVTKYGRKNRRPYAIELLKKDMALIFVRALSDCGVFSRDETGLSQFLYFLEDAYWDRV